MQASPVLVRPARASDAAQVVALEQAAGVEVAFDPAEFHVAESDGRVVACARLRRFPDGTLEIASVAVDSALRGQGVGARLVQRTLEDADGPVHALALAPGFFLRLGFRAVPDVPAALREKLETTCADSRPALLAWTPDASHSARVIRRRYGTIALRARPAGEGLAPGAYAPDELAALPRGAYLALGTGNPVRAAALRPGETLVDLGSGAGVDVLLAARQVGPSGRAIGVDFTPEMVARARANAREAGVAHVEFHEAPIESLPLPDAIADVVTSNCVVNLSADKRAVLREAWRVLRPGGRLVVSDTLRLRGLAPSEAPSCDCTTGALSADEWRALLAETGFVDAAVLPEGAQGVEGGGACCVSPGAEVDAAEGEGCCGGSGDCCGGGSVGRVLVKAVKPA